MIILRLYHIPDFSTFLQKRFCINFFNITMEFTCGMVAQIWVFQNTLGCKHFIFQLFYFKEKLSLDLFFEILLLFQVLVEFFIHKSLVMNLLNKFLLFLEKHHLDVVELMRASIRKFSDCTQMVTYNLILIFYHLF